MKLLLSVFFLTACSFGGAGPGADELGPEPSGDIEDPDAAPGSAPDAAPLDLDAAPDAFESSVEPGVNCHPFADHCEVNGDPGEACYFFPNLGDFGKWRCAQAGEGEVGDTCFEINECASGNSCYQGICGKLCAINTDYCECDYFFNDSIGVCEPE